MHLLPPLLLLSSLSLTLAFPLLIMPDDKILATIEQGQSSVNTSCPADPVREIERLVFESSKSRQRCLQQYLMSRSSVA
jgi:hypothetical protein